MQVTFLLILIVFLQVAIVAIGSDLDLMPLWHEAIEASKMSCSNPDSVPQ